MYFDFEDGHPDIEGVPSALTPREGVLLTVIVHLLVIILSLVLPQLPYFKRLKAAEAAEAQRLAMLQKQQRDQTRFVFMQPRVELTPSKPPERAPMSDRDRRALSQLQAPHPTNKQPFVRREVAAAAAAAGEAAWPAAAADARSGAERGLERSGLQYR